MPMTQRTLSFAGIALGLTFLLLGTVFIVTHVASRAADGPYVAAEVDDEMDGSSLRAERAPANADVDDSAPAAAEPDPDAASDEPSTEDARPPKKSDSKTGESIPAEGQPAKTFDDSGFGSGAFSRPGSGDFGNANQVRNNHLILSWDKRAGTVWGYSDALGKWSKVRTPKDSKRFIPTVGVNIGAIQTDDRIYGYSAVVGRWDELKATASVTVEQSRALVEANGILYAFSESTGRWSSPSRPAADAPADAVPEGTTDRGAALVDAFGRAIRLGDYDGDGTLDVMVAETSEQLSPQDLLAALKARADEAERESTRIAAEYRNASERGGGEVFKLGSQLERLVGDAFERRQQAQRLEAEILRFRLKQVDTRLSERERLKEKIIRRRLNELKNPGEHWDGEEGAERPLRSSERGEESPPQSAVPEDRPVKPGTHATLGKFIAPEVRPFNYAGVVIDVDGEGTILLSQREVSSIRVGDELLVERRGPLGDPPMAQNTLFARVFVYAADSETAAARLVETTRVLYKNKYVFEPVVSGDAVLHAREAKLSQPAGVDTALEELYGRWRFVRSVNAAGDDNWRGRDRALFISGQSFTLADLKHGDIQRAHFGVDASHSPRQIDLVFDGRPGEPDESQRGIYRLEGQKLTICWGPERPTEFKVGKAGILMEFVRE